MGWKKISTLILVILMISISVEAGVSSSIELQDDADLQDEKSNDLADSAWPKYRGGKRNTGRSPYDASHVDGRVKWDLRGHARTRTEPVIGPNGTIYVSYGTLGGNQGTLSAVNPNGTEMWNFHRGRWICSTPAIASDGALYLGINDRRQVDESIYKHIGTFFGVNPNGTEKWNYSVDNRIYSSPTIGEDGTIYVSIGEELYAFGQDGTVKWNLTFEESLNSSPAIATDGTIYVGASEFEDDWEGYLYAVNPDGTKEWSYHTGNGGLNSPTIADDGKIYVTSTQGNLYALESNGTESWKYYTEETKYSSSSIALGDDGTIYYNSRPYLHAVNPDGSERWIFKARRIQDEVSPLIGGDGTIYVGSSRTIHAINAEGEEIWNIDLSDRYGDPYPTATIDENGTLYVAGWGLHALGEKERPDFTEVFTAFLVDNWCLLAFFTIIVIPVTYQIIKFKKKSPSVPYDTLEEDDMEENKEEKQRKKNSK